MGKYFTAFKKETKKPLLQLIGLDDRPDSNYDFEQLSIGIRVEMEHTDNKEIAAVIARDHLDERKDYYSRLKEIMPEEV